MSAAIQRTSRRRAGKVGIDLKRTPSFQASSTNTETLKVRAHTYSNRSAEPGGRGSGVASFLKKKNLKWDRMTAGTAGCCWGLTAAWTEATLTNWANLAAREERESQRTEWLLFSSSLSPHLNFLLSPTLFFPPQLSGSTAHSLTHFNNCPLIFQSRGVRDIWSYLAASPFHRDTVYLAVEQTFCTLARLSSAQRCQGALQARCLVKD